MLLHRSGVSPAVVVGQNNVLTFFAKENARALKMEPCVRIVIVFYAHSCIFGRGILALGQAAAGKVVVFINKIAVGIRFERSVHKFISAYVHISIIGINFPSGKIGKQLAGVFFSAYAEMICAVLIYYRLPVNGSRRLHGHSRTGACGRRGFSGRLCRSFSGRFSRSRDLAARRRRS